MANIHSWTRDGAKRSRNDCLGELEREDISIRHEHGGHPLLVVNTKDVTTGRHFQIELSREETAAVMRIMLRSGAHGMNALRERFEPVS